MDYWCSHSDRMGAWSCLHGVSTPRATISGMRVKKKL